MGKRLTATVGQLIPLHRPARHARSLAQLLAEEPGLQEVIIDGTERRLPGPSDRCSNAAFTAGARSATASRM